MNWTSTAAAENPVAVALEFGAHVLGRLAV